MSTLSELLIATGNRGKVGEIHEALINLPIKLRDLREFPDILAPEESGTSYEENAIIKAQWYAKQTGLWALADDSGLEVAALGGAPGIRSARFGGDSSSDAKRIELLLAKLVGVETEQREATFVCVVTIVEPAGGVVHKARGTCKGRIATAPAGKAGFGYDPVFIPDGQQMSFAEIPAELKNRISHRGKALAATRQLLKSSRR
ncbi:MAG: RdgB/HAM1 family non-canonical purine NTP pyrophosphatase [Pyrinomonadaceae bacterium]